LPPVRRTALASRLIAGGLDRIRNVGGGDLLDAEAVLHVDHDQGGLARIDVVVDVPRAAPQERLLNGPVGDLDGVHDGLRVIRRK